MLIPEHIEVSGNLRLGGTLVGASHATRRFAFSSESRARI